MEQRVISRASVDDFLAQKTLALVGASRHGGKFGNGLLKELCAKGYRVHVIHPTATEIDGVACVRSLAELPERVGGVIFSVKPDASRRLVREAHAAGIQRIWLQKGAESDDSLAFCRENDLDVIHGECLLMYVEPVQSIHSFHRWLRGIFGKLPK